MLASNNQTLSSQLRVRARMLLTRRPPAKGETLPLGRLNMRPARSPPRRPPGTPRALPAVGAKRSILSVSGVMDGACRDRQYRQAVAPADGSRVQGHFQHTQQARAPLGSRALTRVRLAAREAHLKLTSRQSRPTASPFTLCGCAGHHSLRTREKDT